MKVPYYRPSITEDEVAAVVECLRSGWLTTGPRTKEFEAEFARAVGAAHAVALNSCTAALHLALDAVGLRRGDLVLVPTMTFAATAEVVRYFDAVPVFVDCEPDTLCMDVGAPARSRRWGAASPWRGSGRRTVPSGRSCPCTTAGRWPTSSACVPCAGTTAW